MADELERSYATTRRRLLFELALLGERIRSLLLGAILVYVLALSFGNPWGHLLLTRAGAAAIVPHPNTKRWLTCYWQRHPVGLCELL